MTNINQIINEIKNMIDKNGRAFMDSAGNVKAEVKGIAINWHSMFLPEDFSQENMNNTIDEINSRIDNKYETFDSWYSSVAD